jgi:hypothetical protein
MSARSLGHRPHPNPKTPIRNTQVPLNKGRWKKSYSVLAVFLHEELKKTPTSVVGGWAFFYRLFVFFSRDVLSGTWNCNNTTKSRCTQKKPRWVWVGAAGAFWFFKGPLKKIKKPRRSRSVVFAWDCVFLAYFVKTCCTPF